MIYDGDYDFAGEPLISDLAVQRSLLTNVLQPPPPAWLVAALEKFKQELAYANDHFEGVMRYSAVDTNTGVPVALPQPGQTVPPNVRFYFLPRIRCLDCPGKLYTPGPDMSASNFEVHLKNKLHKEKVELRLASANGKSS